MYSFLEISTIYPSFIPYFERKYPECKDLNYKQHYDLLCSEYFGFADNYIFYLNKLGISANNIIVNYEELQSKWAKEHNISANGKSLILKQIEYYEPNVVFMHGLDLVDYSTLNKIKDYIGSIKLLTAFHAAPISELEIQFGREFDIVFTCNRGMYLDFKIKGLCSEFLSHAFEKRVLEQLSNKNKENKLVFAGSLTSGGQFHDDRIEMLNKMQKEGFNLDIYANIRDKNSFSNKMLLTGFRVYSLFPKIFKKIIHRNKSLSRLETLDFNFFQESEEIKYLKNYSRSPKFGLDYYQVLNSASVVFNNHINISGKYAGNIRMFEVTGVGSLLLTDKKIDNNDLFEPGKEILVYDDYNDAIEKVKWALNNPEEAAEIAKAGQERTLNQHTYENRADELNEIILKYLN